VGPEGLGQVHADTHGRPDVAGDRLDLWRDVANGDTRTLAHKGRGDGAADAAGSAGDEGDLIACNLVSSEGKGRRRERGHSVAASGVSRPTQGRRGAEAAVIRV